MDVAPRNHSLPSQAQPGRRRWRGLLRLLLIAGALLVAGVLVWQGFSSSGNPDPMAVGANSSAAILDIGVLVFREGLECVLVLAAITAGMNGRQSSSRSPIAAGAGAGFLATLLTWFAAVGILSDLSHTVSALSLQAATGLLAIVVLLVVMNWFFHKLYWTGWISMHNRRKRGLLDQAGQEQASKARVFWGLALLGFTSFYREGFEVVLFLQSYRLRLGDHIVLSGVAIGLLLTAIVAVLTFLAHQRLPYRKMLVFTGVLLGAVLIVMVGEQVQEMQLAHWLPSTSLPGLQHLLPGWMGLWFSVFPNLQSLLAQALAAALVLGSYFFVSHAAAPARQTSPSSPAGRPANRPMPAGNGHHHVPAERISAMS